MEYRHTDALTRNNYLLVKDMIVDASFMSYLEAKKVLRPDDSESINALATRSDKASHLLHILRRRGKEAMEHFIGALIATEQDHLAGAVEPTLYNEAKGKIQKANDPVDEPDPIKDDGVPYLSINVGKVDTNSEAFKKNLNDLNVYPIKDQSRGRAVIINNEWFYKPETKETDIRKGTNCDMVNLCGLLSQLAYRPDIHNNMSAKEINDIIAKESKRKDHTDSFILALFSHGAQGVVYGSDLQPVKIAHIIEAFDTRNCPALCGKPKLLLIQACQGEKATKGVPQADASEDQVANLTSQLESIRMGDSDPQDAVHWPAGTAQDNSSDVEGGKRVHENADMCVAYSTVSGYLSYRHPETGSWFIRTLVNVFMHYAKEKHVTELLTIVRSKVSEKRTKNGLFVQMPEARDMLLKSWYLFPGYKPQ